MKNKIKIMPLYHQWMVSGKMSHSGLCQTPIGKIPILLDLFEPSDKMLESMDWRNLSLGWWASELRMDDPKKHYTFTPLRQTIVLFCAAINGEL